MAPPAAAGHAGSIVDTAASVGRVVRVVHRPGSVQTEIRIGHVGLPRRIPDFHAVSVMGAILGGLFNSRLNMKLREEKGYTYGAGAGFDLRRGAGPFAARAAVNTEVTVPAIVDTLAELERMRDDRRRATSELAAARDFLIGVFPLRFETAGRGRRRARRARRPRPARRRAGRLSRPDRGGRRSAAVLARRRPHPTWTGPAIVLVGDVDAFGPALEAAGLGRLVIEPDDVVGAPGPATDAAAIMDAPADDLGEAVATDAAPDVGAPGGSPRRCR